MADKSPETDKPNIPESAEPGEPFNVERALYRELASVYLDYKLAALKEYEAFQEEIIAALKDARMKEQILSR